MFDVWQRHSYVISNRKIWKSEKNILKMIVGLVLPMICCNCPRKPIIRLCVTCTYSACIFQRIICGIAAQLARPVGNILHIDLIAVVLHLLKCLDISEASGHYRWSQWRLWPICIKVHELFGLERLLITNTQPSHANNSMNNGYDTRGKINSNCARLLLHYCYCIHLWELQCFWTVNTMSFSVLQRGPGQAVCSLHIYSTSLLTNWWII